MTPSCLSILSSSQLSQISLILSPSIRKEAVPVIVADLPVAGIGPSGPY